MRSGRRTGRQAPDQHEANCLGAFIEAVEELRREPFFSEDDKSILSAQGAKLVARFGDRFHFRSALVTFRRVWLKEEASNFHSICKLIARFEGLDFWLRILREQFKSHTEMRWPGIHLTSREVVDLWLNAVFAHSNIRRYKKPTWRDRIDFDKLVRAHSHDLLEFICRGTVRGVGCAYFNLLPVARSSLARWQKDYGIKPQFEIGAPFGSSTVETNAEGHTIIRMPSTEYQGSETPSQRFERILSRDRFRALKPIFDSIDHDRETLAKSVLECASYQEALAALGFVVELRNVDDLDLKQGYPIVGPQTGVKAVLPWLDFETRQTHITLVQFDQKIVTTRPSVDFFSNKFLELKKQLTQ
jgi:hypothetical protein